MELAVITLLVMILMAPLLYIWLTPETPPLPLETSWRDWTALAGENALSLSRVESFSIDKAA